MTTPEVFITIINTVILWYLYTIIYPVAVIVVIIGLRYLCTPSSKIRFILSYVLFIVWTSTACLIIWPFFVINGKGVRNCYYGSLLLRASSKILGIEFQLKNGKFLSEKTGPAVVVATHQSFFDVLGMFTQWHVMQRCTAIARKKIFWIWPFGLVAWLGGVVFIDRKPSCSKTYETVNKAAEYIHKNKAKLWMFVEGTRNPNPAKLIPFKKGAFRVAISRQLPLIPVVYSPYYFIDGKSMYFGEGRIIMEVLDPIPTKGLTFDDMNDLVSKVYKIMSDKNDELRAQFKKLKEAGLLTHCRNL